VNFLQFLYIAIWQDVYQYAKAQKFFQSSKKKLTKDKVMPNHVEQNQVLDMVDFETNFLPNCN